MAREVSKVMGYSFFEGDATLKVDTKGRKNIRNATLTLYIHTDHPCRTVVLLRRKKVDGYIEVNLETNG